MVTGPTAKGSQVEVKLPLPPSLCSLFNGCSAGGSLTRLCRFLFPMKDSWGKKSFWGRKESFSVALGVWREAGTKQHVCEGGALCAFHQHS